MKNRIKPGFLLRPKYTKLLRLFVDNPGKEFYVNETIRETKLSPQTVCDELKVLEKEGFLKSEKKANARFYVLDEDNVFLADLRRLFF